MHEFSAGKKHKSLCRKGCQLPAKNSRMRSVIKSKQTEPRQVIYHLDTLLTQQVEKVIIKRSFSL